MCSPSTSPEPTRVLFLQASGLGNSILLSPTIQRLRSARPEWVIHLYVYKELFGIPYRGSDLCHQIIVQDGYTPPPRLLRTSYDLSVCAFPSNRWQYHALTRFIGANRRIAHDYPVGYWRTLRFLETDLVPAQPQLHDVAQNMNLLNPLNLPVNDPPDPQFYLSSDEDRKADQFLQEHGLANKHLIGIHPGSGPLSWKRAPLSVFLKLINERGSDASHVLVFGGPEERNLQEQASNRIDIELDLRSYVISAPLKKAAALIDQCELFISNDTGLSHVAAALGVPNQITIFNGTNPVRTRPWRPDVELIQMKKNQMEYPFTATSP